MNLNTKSWNWEAIGSIAEMFAAIATVITVFIALYTIIQTNKEAADARKDAEETRRQQLAIFQGTETNQTTRFQGIVMSTCMQEYFTVRSETIQNLRQSTSPVEEQEVQDLYSERMYGLEFEEYHLFR
jgi:hypothetical protein